MTGAFEVLLEDDRAQLEAFIEDYRRAFDATVDGLTEEQARARLVPSATTLLGLLKHVTWMQRVWFEECVGVGPGLPSVWFESRGVLRRRRRRHHRRCRLGAQAGVRNCPNRRSPIGAGRHRDGTSHRASYRALGISAGAQELAHHCGHADILREQILAGRGGPVSLGSDGSPALPASAE